MIKLLFADDDTEFRKRFSMFLAKRCRDISVSVSGSDALDSGNLSGFEMVLAGKVPADRAEQVFFSGSAEDKDDDFMFLFSDLFPDEVKKIYRYQPADVILLELMAFWKEGRDMPGSEKYGGNFELTHGAIYNDTDTVYVCGFDGGCGKTTVSILLAKAASVYFGRKVLVMSRGYLSDLYDHFRDKDTEGSMDLGILLMNFVKDKNVIPEDHLLTDSTGVCCLRRSQGDPDGYDDLSEKEFEAFIDYVKSWNLFDLFIIDLNGSCRNNIHLLSGADRKTVMVRDMRRLMYRTENIWYLEMFSGITPIIVENCAVQRDKDPVFISEDQLEMEGKEEIEVYYSPESIYVSDGTICVDLSGSLGRCGAALYRKLFLERSAE